MEDRYQQTFDDRRIKVLDFLLRHHSIPDNAEFNLQELISRIPSEEYAALTSDPDLGPLWKDVDITRSLTRFLLDNGLARQGDGGKLQLTVSRGRDLRRQDSFDKLLEDERHITSEARRVSELELEAHRIARRQYKINVLIAFGTGIAALYYILEILNGFLAFIPTVIDFAGPACLSAHMRSGLHIRSGRYQNKSTRPFPPPAIAYILQPIS